MSNKSLTDCSINKLFNFFKRIKPATIQDLVQYLPKNILSLTVQNIQYRKLFRVCRLVKQQENIPDTKICEFKDAEEDQNWISSVSYHPSGEFLAAAKYNVSCTVYYCNPMNKNNFSKVLFNFTDHDLPLYYATFSTKGNLLGTGGSDGKALLYDFDERNTETYGKKILELELVESIRCASISPSEKQYALGMETYEINIYNVDKLSSEFGKVLYNLKIHTKDITSVCYSQCERFLISSGYDKFLIINDLNSPYSKQKGLKNEKISESEDILSLSVSPTNDFIATGSKSGQITIYMLYPYNEGTASIRKARKYSIELIEEHEELVETNKISIDRKGFLELMTILKGHTKDVNSVSFSPSGKYLASASNDKSIIIYDADYKHIGETFGNILTTIKNASWTIIYGICFNLNDEYLASCGYDHAVSIFS